MIEIMPMLDCSKSTPLYVQLYEYIKHEIEIGTIKPETKLPSKRKLSNYLGISQNTIQTSYEQLCSEGYIESRPRIGMFVTKFENNLLYTQSPNDKKIKLKNEFEYLIDFNSGNIDLDNFPYTIWRKLATQCLYSDESDLLSVGDSQGEEDLREEISKYLFQSRNVKCVSEQIIIGAGIQYLMILLCMLLGKDYTYAIENPGYNKVRNVFKDQRIDFYPIPIDENGICNESENLPNLNSL